MTRVSILTLCCKRTAVTVHVIYKHIRIFVTKNDYCHDKLWRIVLLYFPVLVQLSQACDLYQSQLSYNNYGKLLLRLRDDMKIVG